MICLCKSTVFVSLNEVIWSFPCAWSVARGTFFTGNLMGSISMLQWVHVGIDLPVHPPNIVFVGSCVGIYYMLFQCEFMLYRAIVLSLYIYIYIFK